ncbi:hypothetical protein PINS_up020883 [Pythium insidiosum]|nr:hypothetical protein PINS_up020883 [Pythium insidiosum]
MSRSVPGLCSTARPTVARRPSYSSGDTRSAPELPTSQLTEQSVEPNGRRHIVVFMPHRHLQVLDDDDDDDDDDGEDAPTADRTPRGDRDLARSERNLEPRANVALMTSRGRVMNAWN